MHIRLVMQGEKCTPFNARIFLFHYLTFCVTNRNAGHRQYATRPLSPRTQHKTYHSINVTWSFCSPGRDLCSTHYLITWNLEPDTNGVDNGERPLRTRTISFIKHASQCNSHWRKPSVTPKIIVSIAVMIDRLYSSIRALGFFPLKTLSSLRVSKKFVRLSMYTAERFFGIYL